MTVRVPAPSDRDTEPAAWFTATVHPDGRVVLSGELDVAGLDAFRVALDQVIGDPGGLIRIDAARLSFIDSTAVSELLRYQLAATVRRSWLVLEQMSRPVAQVLDLFDLRHIFMAPVELSASRPAAGGACVS